MHRFFLTDQPLVVGKPVDLTPLAHQLDRVLRLQPGDAIDLLDGAGNIFLTTIRQLSRDGATGTVVAQRVTTTEPPLRVHLYQCSLKADKFEWVLQKGTELGVTRFVPVISARSVVRPAVALEKKYPRREAILREAAEQSGRGRLPELAPPLDFAAALAAATGLRLLPWEETAGRDDVSGVGAAVVAALDGKAEGAICSLLVGPEGGLTVEEAGRASAVGWQLTTLGPRILRAETAALAAVTVVMERAGALA